MDAITARDDRPGLHRITGAALAHFTGSDELYHRPPFGSALRYTQGVKYLSDNGLSWLVDLIFSHQLRPTIRRDPRACFQVWTVTPRPGGGAVAECRLDTGEPAIVAQRL